MRPHISLDVRDVAKSVAFYEKVFGMKPQKQVDDYAKFDVKAPALNFSLVSSTQDVSVVNHLGIEVDTVEEIAKWKAHLQHKEILERVEDNVSCCFARQDKLWFTDPDGNGWEIFTVHEQMMVSGRLSQTGCCLPKKSSAHVPAPCGV